MLNAPALSMEGPCLSSSLGLEIGIRLPWFLCCLRVLGGKYSVKVFLGNVILGVVLSPCQKGDAPFLFNRLNF